MFHFVFSPTRLCPGSGIDLFIEGIYAPSGEMEKGFPLSPCFSRFDCWLSLSAAHLLPIRCSWGGSSEDWH